jgi:formate dehydrogenase subunit gamma
MDSDSIVEITHELITPLKNEAGALLPILHAIQDHFAYVPAEVVPCVAQSLGLSRAEVHGAISFYDRFRAEPGGDRTVYICRAESCQAMGGAMLEQAAKEKLGIGFHQTTPDGRFSLEPVYCLGNCACSPAIMIDEQLHSRVSPDTLDKLLESE